MHPFFLFQICCEFCIGKTFFRKRETRKEQHWKGGLKWLFRPCSRSETRKGRDWWAVNTGCRDGQPDSSLVKCRQTDTERERERSERASERARGKKMRSKDLHGLAAYGNTQLARIWFPTSLLLFTVGRRQTQRCSEIQHNKALALPCPAVFLASLSLSLSRG
jgi:hypothetical protein